MELWQRFRGLFAGFHLAHGRYRVTVRAQGGKIQGHASTVVGAVSDKLWQQHLLGEEGVGSIPLLEDNTVCFAAIDIDDYKVDLVELEKKAEGLPVVFCQSKSGGVHVYTFFDPPAPADRVIVVFRTWAKRLGYPKAELFPKQQKRASATDIGNWINLPYFGDTRLAWRGGQNLPLDSFLALAESLRVDPGDWHRYEDPVEPDTAPNDGHFKDGPPCLNQIQLEGGFAEGTRNEGLFNVAIYLRKRFGDDWVQHLADYNTFFCSPPVNDKEIQTIIKSLSRKDYEYRCKQEPLQSRCRRSVCIKRPYGVGQQVTIADIGIDHMTKYSGSPSAVWVVQLTNNARFECSADAFTSQNIFAKYCYDTAGTRLPVVPQQRFVDYINQYTTTAVVVPPFEGSAPEEVFWQLLVDFCVGLAQAKTQEDLRRNQPWHHEGKIYFRPTALMNYLRRQRFSEAKEYGKIASYIHRYNGGSIKMAVGPIEESLWWVPKLELRPESEPEPIQFDKEPF